MPFFNIPWWHNIILLTKLKDNDQRLWYAQKALEYGWSHTILEMQIKSNLYACEGHAITNFAQRLLVVESLPKNLKRSLPSVEEIEAEFAKTDDFVNTNKE
jgi:predicted nuclease of restriction endonuclease-like (RecB) superfamily